MNHYGADSRRGLWYNHLQTADFRPEPDSLLSVREDMRGRSKKVY